MARVTGHWQKVMVGMQLARIEPWGDSVEAFGVERLKLCGIDALLTSIASPDSAL